MTSRHPSITPTSWPSGFTLLEVLVTLAIGGVLMGLGVAGLRPPTLRVAADAALSVVQQARFEAIRSNRPIVVEIDGDQVRTLRGGSATSVDCSAVLQTVRSLDLGDYRGVAVASATGFPFVWLPTGQPRACPDAASPLPVTGIGLVMSYGQRSETVHVGPAGEVGRP